METPARDRLTSSQSRPKSRSGRLRTDLTDPPVWVGVGEMGKRLGGTTRQTSLSKERGGDRRPRGSPVGGGLNGLTDGRE